jgi:hypothetical protein
MLIARSALAVGGLLLSGMVQAQDAYLARLSIMPVDNRNLASISGVGKAEARLEGRELTITASFEGLQGAATDARLHIGSATGVRGPALQELTVSGGRSGSVTGTRRLSAAELDALQAGRLYVQIHSQAAPDGNLWGWLLQ